MTPIPSADCKHYWCTHYNCSRQADYDVCLHCGRKEPPESQCNHSWLEKTRSDCSYIVECFCVKCHVSKIEIRLNIQPYLDNADFARFCWPQYRGYLNRWRDLAQQSARTHVRHDNSPWRARQPLLEFKFNQRLATQVLRDAYPVGLVFDYGGAQAMVERIDYEQNAIPGVIEAIAKFGDSVERFRIQPDLALALYWRRHNLEETV